ncbi:MAG: flagellin N-terminal helical domain-containing protein [Planctomycetota bacterium]|jgi:flagellin
MLAIKNNLMAANAARHLGKSYNALAKSVERLSSGLRINSAKDDAAGLAVRELIRADVGQLNQAARNAADGVSMIQTAEGAMGEIDTILVRMKQLAEQASTGSYSSTQRDIMNNEYSQLSAEITRIAQSTEFNDNELLNSTTAINIHVASGNITVTPQSMTATTLGVDTTAGVKETWVNKRTVAAASDTYILAAEITNGASDMFTFRFGTEETVALDLGSYAATGISLNNLVDAINTEVTTDTGTAYAAASALYNSTYNSYSLQMQARAAGTSASEFTITASSSIALLDNTNDFTETADGAPASGNDLTTATGAAAALVSITTAITTKDTYRADLGYWMNRLEAAESVLKIQAENLMTAESRISDVDVATEMAEMTRTQVLAQAGIAMLAQANTMPQMALTLLR